MKLHAGKVLQVYYEERAVRGTGAPKYFRKRAYGHAEAFLTWCEKEEITSPIAYLRYRFSVGDHGGYVPKLHQLRSNELAKIFLADWKQNHLAHEEGYERLKQKAGSRTAQTVRMLRVLTYAMDAAKHPYWQRSRQDLCLVQMELTGGYHPKSRYCAACPLTQQCAERLAHTYGFDVGALRRGDLGLLPQHIAKAITA